MFLKFTSKQDKIKNSDKIILNGNINFKYQDSIYVLPVLEAMKINGAYKVNMIGTVQKGRAGKNNNADLTDNYN